LAHNETVLRWFILVVALLLDPAAVLLAVQLAQVKPHSIDTSDSWYSSAVSQSPLNAIIDRREAVWAP
jgi:hypothetical protein